MTAAPTSAAFSTVDDRTAAEDAAEPRWAHCPGCAAPAYRPRLRRNLQVCPDCGHHGRLGARERLDQLLDPGSFMPGPDPVRSTDVLGFSDRRPYPERLAEARLRSGLDAAAVYGHGLIGGRPVTVAVMDFAFMGGSMGAAVGETVAAAAELALATGAPLLAVTASGGARMQEGAISLMQMAKTGQAFSRLREHGILSICLLTDPTYGGVTASFAALGDVLVAEPGARIGFAGPQIVRQATGQPLPAGFQRAEQLLADGLLDLVVPRRALRAQLIRLLRLGRPGTPVRDAGTAGVPAVRDAAALVARPAWQVLQTARDIARPTTRDYAARVFDDFVELHGDRLHGDDPAMVGGLASLAGRSVVLVGHQKGHDTRDLVAANFGMPHPEGYRKALRLMRTAGRLGLPVVTLIDTQGAHPGLRAEQRGQAWAIAESIAGMADLPVPVVAVITGEGGSGGALALGVANQVLMLEHSCYSVISPESCSSILYGDAEHGPELAEALRISAPELLRLGVIDAVVPEPAGGSQADPDRAAAILRDALVAALDELAGRPPDELRAHRFERFRTIGPGALVGPSDG